jgi:glycosyltransferase involved in cell wall biosynthesis
MSMQIAQLDPAQITAYYNLGVCEALTGAGHRVTYFASPFIYSDVVYPGGVDVQHLYFRGLGGRWMSRIGKVRQILRGLSYPLGHRAVLAALKRERPDVLHIQWSRLPRFDLPFITRVQALSIPVVHTVHDVVPLYEKQANPLLGQIFAQADALVIHAEANRAELMKTFPDISPERVHLVPMILHQDQFQPFDVTQARARRALGVSEDAPVALFFGSIRHYKGIDTLRDAWRRVAERLPEARLIVAGAPDETLRSVLDDLAALPGVAVSAGYIPAEDAWKYHHAADVIVYPYRHIYQSAALSSGLSAGRAVIVTDVGGLPEMVDGNGWVVPSENAGALAEAIVAALSDRSALVAMGARSRELALAACGPQVVAAALESVYKAAKSVRKQH